jgi:hypothetical protein
VVRLLDPDHRRVEADRGLNRPLTHTVPLEPGELDVEGPVKTEGRYQRQDEPPNQLVKIRGCLQLGVQRAAAQGQTLERSDTEPAPVRQPNKWRSGGPASQCTGQGSPDAVHGQTNDFFTEHGVVASGCSLRPPRVDDLSR